MIICQSDYRTVTEPSQVAYLENMLFPTCNLAALAH